MWKVMQALVSRRTADAELDRKSEWLGEGALVYLFRRHGQQGGGKKRRSRVRSATQTQPGPDPRSNSGTLQTPGHPKPRRPHLLQPSEIMHTNTPTGILCGRHFSILLTTLPKVPFCLCPAQSHSALPQSLVLGASRCFSSALVSTPTPPNISAGLSFLGQPFKLLQWRSTIIREIGRLAAAY